MTSRHLVTTLVALGFVVVVSTPVVAQPATPSPTCGDGTDTGTLYRTNSGVSIIDDSEARPPPHGTFRSNTTAQIGTVTFSGRGNSSVRVENATTPVCLAAITTTESPLNITVENLETIEVSGTVEQLAIGSVNSTLTVGYDANESVSVTVANASFESGTRISVTDRANSTLTTGTVSEAGMLTLTLPPGSRTVSLISDSEQSAGTQTPVSSAAHTPPVDTTSDITETERIETGRSSGADTDQSDRSVSTASESDTEPSPSQTMAVSESATTGSGPGFGIILAITSLCGGLILYAGSRGD